MAGLGGAEIILILGLLLVLAVVALGVVGVVYLVVRIAVNRPAPLPSTLPPDVAVLNQQRKDREQIKLTSLTP